MSPILVRPVREQLEHDRIIRLLHAKTKRKNDAGMNPGAEKNSAVGAGPSAIYPDLVLFSADRGRKPETIIEVETGESVNHLEALAEWAHFSRVRAAFHLYVPSQMVDVARRLCEDNQIHVNEVWSYHSVGDEIRFTLVQRSRDAAPSPRVSARVAVPAARKKPVAKVVAKSKKPAAPKAVNSKAAKSKAAKPAKPVKAAKAVKSKRR